MKEVVMKPQDRTFSLNSALSAFESTALNVSLRFISDASARAEYNKKAEAFSVNIIHQVRIGKITAAAGAQKATDMRSILMDTLKGKIPKDARTFAVNL